MTIYPLRCNSNITKNSKYKPARTPPSHRLNLKPVHMKIRQQDTPMIVAGIIIFITSGTEAAEIVKGDTIAAIPIESIGSVMFEPIRVPIATP